MGTPAGTTCHVAAARGQRTWLFPRSLVVMGPSATRYRVSYTVSGWVHASSRVLAMPIQVGLRDTSDYSLYVPHKTPNNRSTPSHFRLITKSTRVNIVTNFHSMLRPVPYYPRFATVIILQCFPSCTAFFIPTTILRVASQCGRVSSTCTLSSGSFCCRISRQQWWKQISQARSDGHNFYGGIYPFIAHQLPPALVQVGLCAALSLVGTNVLAHNYTYSSLYM